MRKHLLLIVSLLLIMISCKQEETTPVPVAVESVELNHSSLTLKVGESETLVATIYPDNAENKGVSWYSSADDVATVSRGKVTAVSMGEIVITVLTDDGGYVAECIVTVTDNNTDDVVVPVERVELNRESLTMTVGEEQTLTATVYPSDATNRNLIWESSSSSVVSVNNGRLTALSAGTAIISVTTEDGGYKAACEVDVTLPDNPSWGLCGTFNDWGKNGEDIPFTWSDDVKCYVVNNLELGQNAELKFRYCNSWDENYGAQNSNIEINAPYSLIASGENIVIPKAGSYDIYLDLPSRFYIMEAGFKPGFLAEDLSEDGTANCYIVDPYKQDHDVYKFKASPRYGGYTDISADVTWESYGSSTPINKFDLIPYIWYDNENEYIYFAVKSETPGNALLSLKSSEGTVLRSWHIWITEMPSEQTYYNNAGILMDRNLGATSASPGDKTSIGLLYQYGRSHPFVPSSIESSIQWPEPEDVVWDESPTTIDAILGDLSTDWTSGNAIMYGPCPRGWRVPDGVWNNSTIWSTALQGTDLPKKDSAKGGWNASGYMGEDPMMWYPFIDEESTQGNYSVPYWTNGCARGTSSSPDNRVQVMSWYELSWSKRIYKPSQTGNYSDQMGFIRCQKM